MTFRIDPKDIKIKTRKKFGSENPHIDFLQELISSGYAVTEIVPNNIQRVDAPGDKRGKKSGWYIYQEFHTEESYKIGCASYGDWRDGSSIKWLSQSESTLSTEQRAFVTERQERAKAIREQAELDNHNRVAQEAQKQYQESKLVKGHNYLEAKGITWEDARVNDKQELLIPVYDESGMVNLQRIAPNGSKKFLYQGKKKGCWLELSGDTDTVFICEGFSTGMSIHEATEKTVFVAWDAYNLSSVAYKVKRQFPEANIVIASDNDESGTGQTHAASAASAINAEVAVSPVPTDFNDMAQKQGLKKVHEFLMKHHAEPETEKPKKQTKATKYEPPATLPKHLHKVPGALGDVTGYYMQTAFNPQDVFATQTALAIGSMICGRWFCTDRNDWTSLFFLSLGPSGCGKEHIKTVIKKILQAADMSDLAISGYMSRGGVYTVLEDMPRHIAIIDEIGDYMQGAKNNPQSLRKEVNEFLKEAATNLHTTVTPPAYSQKTIAKSNRTRPKPVYNPAITIAAMGASKTFYKSIDISQVEDGFFGRFVFGVTEKGRQKRRQPLRVDVPDGIIDWINAISKRKDFQADMSHDAPGLRELTITMPAMELLDKFDEEVLDYQDRLEKWNLSELLQRTTEYAKRIALIVALSRDPNTEEIWDTDMAWAIDYVRHASWTAAQNIKRHVASSPFERHKKEALTTIRDMTKGGGWAKHAELMRRNPFNQLDGKTRLDVINAMIEAEYIIDATFSEEGKVGRPKRMYKEKDA